MRIMVVDDDHSQRLLLKAMLGRMGHEPVVVPDARAALARLADGAAPRCDLILADWSMPGLDGLEFLAALREQGRGQPVAIVTGHDDPGSIETARRAGACGVLTKPIDGERLAAVLRSCSTAP